MKNVRDIVIQEVIRSIAIWAILVGVGIPLAEAIGADVVVALAIVSIIPVIGFFALTVIRARTGRTFMITSERGFAGLRVFSAGIGIVIIIANTIQGHIPAVAAIGFISLIVLVAYLFTREKAGIHE